jgi:hypothetical protein
VYTVDLVLHQGALDILVGWVVTLAMIALSADRATRPHVVVPVEHRDPTTRWSALAVSTAATAAGSTTR